MFRGMEEDEEEEKLSRASLVTLPWEDVVFAYIFCALDFKDLFCLRQTCKTVMKMVDEYFSVSPVVDLSRVAAKIPRDVGLNVLVHCTVLRKLNLANCRWVRDEDMKPLFAQNPHLISVDLSGCSGLTDKSIIMLALKCKELKILNMTMCVWLSPHGVETLALHLRNLERADFSSCWEVNNASIMKLVFKNPRLKSLHLTNIYGLTDQLMSAIAAVSSQLVELSVSGCWRISDHGIRLVGEHCRNLKQLYVFDCREITERSLAPLRTRMMIDRPVINIPPYAKVNFPLTMPPI